MGLEEMSRRCGITITEVERILSEIEEKLS